MIYTWVMAIEKMTLKQAMNFLGIKSRITMRKYADAGIIPSERVRTVSGEWRVFKKKDLSVFKAKMIKEPANGMSYLPFITKKPSPKK